MKIPRRGILAGGNWIVDFTKIIDVFPAQDALANILGEYSGNGGSAYNVLIDLARLQAPFPLEAIGLVGDDRDGENIRQDCAAHGIDTTQLHVSSKLHTSYTHVMLVKSSGRRTFFHQRGANALLGPEHFDFSKSSAKIFHLGYLLLLDELDKHHATYGTVAAGILQAAQKAGFKTSIDVVSEDSDRFAAVVMPALRYTDYAIMNEFEAERTTGERIRTEQGLDPQGLQTAVRKLFEAGVRQWVVIHFPEGAVAANPAGPILHQASVCLPREKNRRRNRRGGRLLRRTAVRSARR